MFDVTWARRMLDAEVIGGYCFRQGVSEAPGRMASDELWAWDMGYRLAQHLQINGTR
jgi:hypothetical protein